MLCIHFENEKKCPSIHDWNCFSLYHSSICNIIHVALLVGWPANCQLASWVMMGSAPLFWSCLWMQKNVIANPTSIQKDFLFLLNEWHCIRQGNDSGTQNQTFRTNYTVNLKSWWTHQKDTNRNLHLGWWEQNEFSELIETKTFSFCRADIITFGTFTLQFNGNKAISL